MEGEKKNPWSVPIATETELHSAQGAPVKGFFSLDAGFFLILLWKKESRNNQLVR